MLVAFFELWFFLPNKTSLPIMSSDLKTYYENHRWWWAGTFFSFGVAATIASGKFLYFDPREREINSLQRLVDEARSSSDLQKIQANRDVWINHSRKLESKLSACNNNAMILSEIAKLTEEKRVADYWVDFFLSGQMNSGNEPSRSNMLRSEEYRRQAAQLQEQILGMQSKIAH